MATPPSLRTGASCQFPVKKQIAYRTTVLQFVDGQEQRFRKTGTPELRWSLGLQDLNEEEAVAQLQFLEGQQGAAQPMSFTDPFSGEILENCYLGDDRTQIQATGEGRRSIALNIVSK